jgi:Skp family chaperone for outer membrane proteins
MHDRHHWILGAALAASVAAEPLLAAAADAPAAAAAAAPAPVAPAAAALGGPSIPGLCLLSEQDLVGRSKVGGAASARFRTLKTKVDAELQTRKASLEASAKAFQAKAPTMPPAQAAQEQHSLQQRAQALDALAGQRQVQLAATQAKVSQRLQQDAMPLIEAAYQAHGCGVLFDRSAVVVGGAGMDITAEVIQALDAKETTITFDLEPPPASSGR